MYGSIRYKLHAIAEILLLNNINILVVSETHLDSTFEDAELKVHEYRIFSILYSETRLQKI